MFEKQKLTPWFQNPMNLGQRRLDVGYRAKCERTDDRVEARCIERQTLGRQIVDDHIAIAGGNTPYRAGIERGIRFNDFETPYVRRIVFEIGTRAEANLEHPTLRRSKHGLTIA